MNSLLSVLSQSSATHDRQLRRLCGHIRVYGRYVCTSLAASYVPCSASSSIYRTKSRLTKSLLRKKNAWTHALLILSQTLLQKPSTRTRGERPSAAIHPRTYHCTRVHLPFVGYDRCQRVRSFFLLTPHISTSLSWHPTPGVPKTWKCHSLSVLTFPSLFCAFE